MGRHMPEIAVKDNARTKLALSYQWMVILAGAAILGISTYYQGIPDLTGALSLAVLATIAESQAVPVGGKMAISVGFALDFCALLIYGPVTAMWVVFLSLLFSINNVKGQGYKHLFNIPLHFTLFNCMNLAISIFAAGKLYELLGGKYIYSAGLDSMVTMAETLKFLSPMLPFLILTIMTHIIINTSVITFYLAIQSGVKAFSQWMYNFRWAVINLIIIGIIGVTITLVYRQFKSLGLLIFMAPLLLARYTFVQYIKMREVYLNTIKTLTAAIEAKDKYTMGHSQRVEDYSRRIAFELKLTPDRMEMLRYAALLHDIGKIGVAEAILNKPDRLSDDEFETIRQHPMIGSRILEDVDFLKNAVKIILSHHERYDGKGYPMAICEDNIPIEAQIMSVADTYDAMTSDRPYRKAKSHEEALKEIQAMSGTQFSPKVVDAFQKALSKGGFLP
ncbi:MAG TPA: hypothetical protein DD727_07850 [Clostridiales bacterium]|nr:hypothetical protein [Clostridiales bacterium]